jgi:ABC-type lipoprotein export system ATPase subunit
MNAESVAKDKPYMLKCLAFYIFCKVMMFQIYILTEIICTNSNNYLHSNIMGTDASQEKLSMVVVMGVTGSGKSYFINHLAGREVVQEGSTLDSCWCTTRRYQAQEIR